MDSLVDFRTPLRLQRERNAATDSTPYLGRSKAAGCRVKRGNWWTLLAAIMFVAVALFAGPNSWAQSQTEPPDTTTQGGLIKLRQPAAESAAAPVAPAAATAPAALTAPGGAAGAQESALSAENAGQPKGDAFERYIKLKRFGSDMVADLAAGAADYAPIVPPDYLVQTGDELRVSFWGSVDADLRLVVDRGGQITIPRVGPVMVAGQRYADLRALITRRAALVFKNFDVNVSLARLRGVRVYVTGFVQRPGAYVVSSLSTAMNAVMRAGGPAASGSYRQIELRRAGQPAVKLDLYDLLVRGDRSGDRLLQPDDVVYVAAIGPQVAIIGSVNREAIYELKPGEGLADLMQMAGGFNAIADHSRVALERVADRNAHRIVELKLPAEASAPLVNGDVVRAFSAVDSVLSIERQNKRVRVDGEVGRPGEYLLPPDATIADALRAAGGLTPGAFLFGTQFTRESVRQTQQENYDRALRDLETDMVRSSATMRVATAEEAAAASASASANQRLLQRLRALKPSGRIAMQLAADAKALPNLALEDGDTLTIPARPTTVGVFGSVFTTGSFLYANGRTVADYLQQAGGPTRGADKSSVFLVRANGTVESSLQRGGGGIFSRSVPISDLNVDPGDAIFVPEEQDKTTWTTFAKDWTTILFNFGLGAAGLKQALGW